MASGILHTYLTLSLVTSEVPILQHVYLISKEVCCCHKLRLATFCKAPTPWVLCFSLPATAETATLTICSFLMALLKLATSLLFSFFFLLFFFCKALFRSCFWQSYSSSYVAGFFCWKRSVWPLAHVVFSMSSGPSSCFLAVCETFFLLVELKDKAHSRHINMSQVWIWLHWCICGDILYFLIHSFSAVMYVWVVQVLFL